MPTEERVCASIAWALEKLIGVLFNGPRGGPVVGVTQTSTTDPYTSWIRCDMDTALDREGSKVGRPGALVALVQAMRGMVARLISFFALTQADRLKVGIYWRNVEGDG